MLRDTQRSKKRRKIAAAVCLGLVILLLGMVAGFFISKYVGTVVLTHCYSNTAAAIAAATGSSTGHTTQFRRGASLAPDNLQQLPAPGSDEATELQGRPHTAEAILLLYTYYDDAALISEELTVAFLQQLQQVLAGDGQQPFPDTNLTEVVDMFAGVARDVLSYLRHSKSEALLLLLRQFSSQGAISVADVNPDVLQREVGRLLNLTTMNTWYGTVTKSGGDSVRTDPPPARNASSKGNTAQLLEGATTSGRRLLAPLQLGQQQSRQLQAAASIPAIQAAADGVLPTASPRQGMQDMLCGVKSFSPTGLQGMTLPPQNGAAVDASGKAIVCSTPPELGTFQDGDLAFKPVVIPVVFHCQRFMQGDVLQPPIWKAEEAGQNLIDVANKLYKHTGIQFKLQEVRHDVVKHPYLLLPSLDDWQLCTGNPSQESASFSCLKDTAKLPEVAALADQHVINVFVGGSQTSMFCNRTESEVCTTLYWGYCVAFGPWFARPSATWTEDSSEENWVFITWDMFDPSVKNSWRFWDGGAVTFAHEVGHYLGLMHTHEGSVPCEGDGIAKADSVPDTPVNLQTEQWAAQNGLAVQLAKWCSEFRNGKKPQPKDLLSFNSCKEDSTVDNVFNLLSYLPDQCCMTLSPNQVARLQWATTTFRRKMMAKYSV